MSEGEKAVPLQVRLEPQLRTSFKLVCTKQDRSMSDVLVEFISWYTQKKES